GDGPFTVFAPTDEAFAKLPAGTVESLLEPQNRDKLKEILLLHVVPGKVLAKDVLNLSEATTAGGGKLSISADGGVKVGTSSGKANVVKTDIAAKNGVIHVIDSVILP
ncbi:MAG: fasciclin domain-containing protein, partial [Planctomycetaceae bacterium]